MVENYQIPMSYTSYHPVVIPNDQSEVGVAHAMASMGLSFDKADNTYLYMSQYMDTIVHNPLAPDSDKGFAECALQQGRAILLIPPWPNMILFTWSDFHQRWIPQVETAPTEAATVVVATSTSGTIPLPSVDRPGEPVQKPNSPVTPQDIDMSSLGLMVMSAEPSAGMAPVSSSVDEETNITLQTLEEPNKMDFCNSL